MSRLRPIRRTVQPLLTVLAVVLSTIVAVRLVSRVVFFSARVSTTGSEQVVANPHGYSPSVLAIQTARNKTIQRVCDMRRPLETLSKEDKRTLLSHLIVEPRHKLLYCYVPKVACTNWKDTIRQLQSSGSEVAQWVQHNEGLRMLSSYSEEDTEYILRNFFKFLFVRHPLSRLLSAFKDKFRNEPYIMKRYGVDIVKECRQAFDATIEQTDGSDVSFAEFVCYLMKHPVEEFNEHWMPAFKLCQPCSVTYDFIGKYENLEEEANTILETKAQESGLAFPHRQAKYHPVQQSERKKLIKTLSTASLKELQDIFDLDFTLFMYDRH